MEMHDGRVKIQTSSFSFVFVLSVTLTSQLLSHPFVSVDACDHEVFVKFTMENTFYKDNHQSVDQILKTMTLPVVAC